MDSSRASFPATKSGEKLPTSAFSFDPSKVESESELMFMFAFNCLYAGAVCLLLSLLLLLAINVGPLAYVSELLFWYIIMGLIITPLVIFSCSLIVNGLFIMLLKLRGRDEVCEWSKKKGMMYFLNILDFRVLGDVDLREEASV